MGREQRTERERGEREEGREQRTERERGEREGEWLPVGCWRIPDRLIQHLCSSLEYLCRDTLVSMQEHGGATS